MNGSVWHPLLYRGWLEGILELFLFLLAVSAHFDSENHDHGDDNENNDGDDNGFEQEFEETHGEEYCWASTLCVRSKIDITRNKIQPPIIVKDV